MRRWAGSLRRCQRGDKEQHNKEAPYEEREQLCWLWLESHFTYWTDDFCLEMKTYWFLLDGRQTRFTLCLPTGKCDCIAWTDMRVTGLRLFWQLWVSKRSDPLNKDPDLNSNFKKKEGYLTYLIFFIFFYKLWLILLVKEKLWGVLFFF